MSDEAQKIQEVDAEIAGQKVKITGANLNMLFTVAGFIGVCLIGYVVFTHAADTREASKEQVAVMKDLTQAIRESTCVAVIKDAEQCRRITR